MHIQSLYRASLSLLIKVKSFENLKFDEYTKFDGLLTDMPKFIKYLSAENYNGVPPRLANILGDSSI
jgi:hypothetical protein